MPDSRVVSVFGSSEPASGEPAYLLAVDLGGALARAGFTVMTGGYGGVMEAASRGAREAGGRTVGIGCATFLHRDPNPFLDRFVVADDLHLRTRELVDQADGYVVLPGKAGTLAELALVWALNRAGCLVDRPVLLLGAVWPPLIEALSSYGMLEPRQIDVTRLVPDPAAAVAELTRHFGGLDR